VGQMVGYVKVRLGLCLRNDVHVGRMIRFGEAHRPLSVCHRDVHAVLTPVQCCKIMILFDLVEQVYWMSSLKPCSQSMVGEGRGRSFH